MSTAPDLHACVLRVLQEHPGRPLVIDLRRVWFCDLAGLRALGSLSDHGREAGTRIEVCGSASIARIGRLVEQVRAAQIA